MDPGSVLTTAVEVAIAIAGFAGIVVVLGPRRGHEWTASSRILLSALFFMSIATVTFGFLPPILSTAGVGEHLLWPIASALHAAYLTGITGYRIQQTVRLPKEERPTSVAALFVVVLGALTLQSANAIWLHEAWPYLTAIVLMVVLSFSVFLALLQRLLAAA